MAPVAALEDRLYTRWSHRGEPASAVCYRVADGVVLGVRAAPEQIFDSGGVFGGDTSKGVPVVSYGDDVDFAARMREDFDNCEYRTCFVAFAPRAV